MTEALAAGPRPGAADRALLAAGSPVAEPEARLPLRSDALLEPTDRLAFERRRLPLRLLLMACPVLLLLSVGPVGLPVAAVMAVAGIGSYALVASLLRHRPDLVLRGQLALRAMDVGLLFVALDGTNLLVGGAYFDAAYIISVLSATATHGRRGTLAIAGLATLAMIGERWHLAAVDGRALAGPDVFAALSYTVLFVACGASVASLMRTSAAVVERRERSWRDELAGQNAALERAGTQLAATNRELEAFAYSVSHDLRAPLRAIDGFGRVLEQTYGGRLDDRGRDYLRRVRLATQRMGQLIDDLLNLSRVTRAELQHERVDLSAIGAEVVAELRETDPGREVTVEIEPGLTAEGDGRLLRVALQNLIGNAWKFTSRRSAARIVVGSRRQAGEVVYFVRDNGAGFDMEYAGKLFGAFQRLHTADEFDGTGVGLATVQRIVHRHGGRVWAEGAVDQGATIYFTLG